MPRTSDVKSDLFGVWCSIKQSMITLIKVCDNRSRGYVSLTPRFCHCPFAIDLPGRRYATVLQAIAQLQRVTSTQHFTQCNSITSSPAVKLSHCHSHRATSLRRPHDARLCCAVGSYLVVASCVRTRLNMEVSYSASCFVHSLGVSVWREKRAVSLL